jgi:hypothetical protein
MRRDPLCIVRRLRCMRRDQFCIVRRLRCMRRDPKDTYTPCIGAQGQCVNAPITKRSAVSRLCSCPSALAFVFKRDLRQDGGAARGHAACVI